MKRIAITLVLAGCVYPGKATREERLTSAAEERGRYCDRDVEPAVEEIRNDIHAAQPLYVKLRTGPKAGNYSVKLVGAQLYVPGGHGMTPEELERVLRCHQARSALGDISPTAADPFSLADAWIDIRVRPERWGLVVNVRGQTPEEGQLIDSKAQRLWSRSASGAEGGSAARGEGQVIDGADDAP
jgi:hypothetical protein